MSSANRQTPPRRTPPAGSGTAAPAVAGPATIRALPPPPQMVATGKGTPAAVTGSPAQTLLGYTTPVEPAAVELAPEDLLPPGSRVGDYEIDELIGAGGMGSVYSARYPMIDRKVAIKVIASHLCRDPDVVQQFVIEARAANQIANRHVVDIHTLGTLPDGRPYLVMELLRGETLTQRLSYGPLDVADAVPILDQIAEAMEAAHDVPIVHRDLKPDNVFLEDADGPPQVKILDFGIAKLGDAAPAGDAQAQGTTLVGTPHYMAPEQARAQLVGTPADLYALGLIAFEMLAGRAPFEAESAAEILAAHQTTLPPALRSLRPDVPEGLDELVDRLLAKDPGDRPTATEVRWQLRALYARKSYPRVVPAVDLPFREQARLWLQRPRNQLLLGAQLVIGVLMLAAYLFIGDDEEPGASTPATEPAVASPAVPASEPVTPPVAPTSTAPVEPGPTAAPTAPAAPETAAPEKAAPETAAPAPAPEKATPAPEKSAPATPAPREVPPVARPLPDSSSGAPAPAGDPPPRVDRDAPIRDPF